MRSQEDKDNAAVLKCLVEKVDSVSDTCSRQVSRSVRSALSFYQPVGAPVLPAVHLADHVRVLGRPLEVARARLEFGRQHVLCLAICIAWGLPHAHRCHTVAGIMCLLGCFPLRGRAPCVASPPHGQPRRAGLRSGVTRGVRLQGLPLTDACDADVKTHCGTLATSKSIGKVRSCLTDVAAPALVAAGAPLNKVRACIRCCVGQTGRSNQPAEGQTLQGCGLAGGSWCSVLHA